MLIFPAIDIIDGKTVRLFKGDFSTAHQVAGDAVETAFGFLKAGTDCAEIYCGGRISLLVYIFQNSSYKLNSGMISISSILASQ